MKKTFSRIIGGFLAILLAFSPLCPKYDAIASETTEETAPMPYRDLTSAEITEEMGLGWNLGNTMDGHTGFTPNETLWQNVRTTKQTIKGLHDLGFNTVRIPVTWGSMIDDENDYSINENWMSRVQDIVDYCISEDMYVIINIHHDGAEQTGWLRIATDDKDALYDKFEGVWKTIAARFKNYDEHVIFEAMNEVRGEGMSLAEENSVIMDLNQIFVDTVRASGGNNDRRWLVVCGKYNYIDSIVNEAGKFELPKDSAEGKIILSCHIYTPWDFCGNDGVKQGEYSIDKFKKTNVNEIESLKKFTDKGIPVIAGEYGCMNRMSVDGDGFNTADRALYLEAMNYMFKKVGIIGVYWDQGWYDRSMSPDCSFAILDRETGETIDKEVTDAMIRGYYLTDSLDSIVESPDVKEITEINVTDKLTLKVGEYIKLDVTSAPADSNDFVLYSTDDCQIATVYNGLVHGKTIGTTTINVYSQSGSVVKQIDVTVEPEETSTKCDEIICTEVIPTIAVDKAAYLNAYIGTENCDAFLTYYSSDETVATVSPIGKITGVGEGSTRISIVSSDGYSVAVDVEVISSENVDSITLALNVYYNDSTNSYWGNEYSDTTITVSESGQYTLTFDCEKDLSEEAIAAGVTSLTRLTAIYIKDHDVTLGNATKSPMDSCDIMFDKIVVDGVELTITQTEPKSALKSSGIFDTNDPINSWDGSVVEEVKCANNVVSFAGMEPKKIEVTFTLTNMQFTGSEKLPDAVIDTPETESETLMEFDTDFQTKAVIDEGKNKKGGLPVGAIVGISLGVAAVVVTTAGYIIINKRKKQK